MAVLVDWLKKLFQSFICRVLQKIRSVFQRRSLRKTTDPILPVQNPVASTHNEKNFCNDSIPMTDSERDDEELHFDHFETGVYSGQQWPGENLAANTPACTSAREGIADWNVFLEQITQQNVDSSLEDQSGEEEEEEENGMIKSIINVDEGKWINHYSSCHRILLVGEGDFSFSASLALAFGCASNMIATSLDSQAFLKENYGNAQGNIMELRKRGCKVMHEIDATKMANHALLGPLKFDRIIFNFPFAGFFKTSSRSTQLILHRNLVSRFLENAKEMMSENGEIHITHKTNCFHIEWNLESLASRHGLYLKEAIKFNHWDYPGYRTKCGFGGDNNFNCNPSKTYKFGRKRSVYC